MHWPRDDVRTMTNVYRVQDVCPKLKDDVRMVVESERAWVQIPLSSTRHYNLRQNQPRKCKDVFYKMTMHWPI